MRLLRRTFRIYVRVCESQESSKFNYKRTKLNGNDICGSKRRLFPIVNCIWACVSVCIWNRHPSLRRLFHIKVMPQLSECGFWSLGNVHLNLYSVHTNTQVKEAIRRECESFLFWAFEFLFFDLWICLSNTLLCRRRRRFRNNKLFLYSLTELVAASRSAIVALLQRP